jgi:NAD(P)-dependent dehydrogenase (short-subunit alcohol dehydrogenase family)
MRPTIFITGAAQGIGRACAKRFASRGFTVGLYDIDEPGLAALAEEIGRDHGSDKVCWQRLDVCDGASIDAGLRQFAAHTGGRLDVLLNNAGVLSVGPFEQIDLAAHRKMIAVNVQGLLEVAHRAFPLLRDTPGARLINMSSGSAIYGIPEMASYSATKHFVRGLTEALDLEWRRHDIAVCDVMPMFVATALLTNTATANSMGRLGVRLCADDVADVVWTAANARGRAARVHWPVGLQTAVAFAAKRLSPSWLDRTFVRWMCGQQ